MVGGGGVVFLMGDRRYLTKWLKCLANNMKKILQEKENSILNDVISVLTKLAQQTERSSSPLANIRKH